jgi:hypothetical protein
MISEVRLELRKEGAVIPADHWQTCLNQDILTMYNSDKIVAKKVLKEALLQGVPTGEASTL